MFGTARCYIETNLHQMDLTPESVLRVPQLSRATLYGLFEHEGGLATTFAIAGCARRPMNCADTRIWRSSRSLMDWVLTAHPISTAPSVARMTCRQAISGR
jgi:hypothetical protein